MKLDIGPETPRTYELAQSIDRGIQKDADLLRKAMMLAKEMEGEVERLLIEEGRLVVDTAVAKRDEILKNKYQEEFTKARRRLDQWREIACELELYAAHAGSGTVRCVHRECVCGLDETRKRLRAAKEAE